MGGLRALCCSKGDQDDDQHPPSRPAQCQPEKETQSLPNNVEDGRLTATEVTGEKPAPRDLWKEAYDNLDIDRKKYLSSDGASATDAISQVIDDTTASYEKWKNSGIKINRGSENEIDLRESKENIIRAARNAKDAISAVVSFDPTGYGEL
ncbi:hypothetical protein N7528_003983 [Penicillium herquei]|nr:hypothetical protein N7528_003983 [Penicillium herquei]